ncbi:hypothetical protein VV02_15765 [Luteipulveratus mongoliensis]|uniref:non-specific serine/threonine protein kinase n=2 Tax=Luteipulveratus mongoliensis TaxID=571913 RepID=A0A0K1JQW7_9MICO|nr:hypothetical protein VV02_15765 [Luteipulveratus mongoliensis]
MGEVYAAYDTVKDRTVALKLLPVELASDPDYQERFRREARTAARLQEPHVIPIHDFGEIDGVLYIDMRLVNGRDLRSVLREERVLRPGRAVAIAGQIAAALDAAHADGLVHRDVKPENVLLTESDFAYLADFGIASRENDSKLTTHGSAIGSFAYMAPERFDDAPVSGQADVYSLGCLLHECLTGSTPYPSRTVSAQIKAHLYQPPPLVSSVVPQVPPGLDHVLLRALAKNPAERQRTAGELAAAAKAALSGAQATEANTVIAQAGAGAPSPHHTAPIPRRDLTPHPTGRPPGQAGQSYAAGPPPYDPRQPAAHPVPMVTQAPRRDQERRSPVIPILLTVLVVAVLGVVGLIVRSTFTGDDKQADNPGASVSLTDAAPAPTATSTAAPTTATPSIPGPAGPPVDPPSSATSSSSAAPTTASPTTGPGLSGPGYDYQGWVSTPTARCNYIDPAMMVASSKSTKIVICRTETGAYYYRGHSTKSGQAIEIANPVKVSGGWRVDNKGVTYDISSAELWIHRGTTSLLREPMTAYDEG